MRWGEVKQDMLRTTWYKFLTREHVQAILQPYADLLAAYPLYITLDKVHYCQHQI